MLCFSNIDECSDAANFLFWANGLLFCKPRELRLDVLSQYTCRSIIDEDVGPTDDSYTDNLRQVSLSLSFLPACLRLNGLLEPSILISFKNIIVINKIEQLSVL